MFQLFKEKLKADWPKGTLTTYSAVFTEELGCVQGPPVKLLVPQGAEPKFISLDLSLTLFGVK